MSVSDLLIAAFPDIFGVGFTSDMEEGLDNVEEGKSDWQEVLGNFYDKFTNEMSNAEKTMPNLKAGIKTEHICPDCSSNLLLRYGKMGRFFACPKYPDCTTTFEVSEDKDGKLLKIAKPEFDDKCPKCESKMLFKRSRFGAFLACSTYPDCRGVIPLKKIGEHEYEVEPVEIITRSCPECGSEMEAKRSRYGRFIACSTYPDCTGSLPYLMNVKCPSPDCEDGELCERQSKRGTYYPCIKYPDCKFRSYNFPVVETCPTCKAPTMFKVKGELRCGVPECEGTLPDPEAEAEEKRVAEEDQILRAARDSVI